VSHSHDNTLRAVGINAVADARLCAYQLCRIRNPDYVDTFIMKHFFNAWVLICNLATSSVGS